MDINEAIKQLQNEIDSLTERKKSLYQQLENLIQAKYESESERVFSDLKEILFWYEKYEAWVSDLSRSEDTPQTATYSASLSGILPEDTVLPFFYVVYHKEYIHNGITIFFTPRSVSINGPIDKMKDLMTRYEIVLKGNEARLELKYAETVFDFYKTFVVD